MARSSAWTTPATRRSPSGTADDPEAVEAAVGPSAPSWIAATSAWSPRAPATPSRSRLPVDADLVIMRLPISGG